MRFDMLGYTPQQEERRACQMLTTSSRQVDKQAKQAEQGRFVLGKTKRKSPHNLQRLSDREKRLLHPMVEHAKGRSSV